MCFVGLKGILVAFCIYINFSSSYPVKPIQILVRSGNVYTHYLIGISERMYNKF